MINRKELDALYELYGFEKGEETENLSIYLHTEGFFNNVEIVQIKANYEEVSLVKEQYFELGYSVHTSIFNSYEETNASLFSAFFNVKQSNKRLLEEYNNYCKLQTKKMLGSNYSYVEGHFYTNGRLVEEGLIEHISNQISESGPQLIILEAAAGYGKTCASYEILKRLAVSSENKAPLLAELSKNRTASIFKYVLLSEIDRKFKSLSSQLVTCEIRNGRVPLIIDGFDELLSKANSQSESNSNEVEEAQTMLDTIAELLINNSNAKILLTSRKSSIFTGATFDDWVERKLYSCNITRVQLAEPTTQAWIGYEKVALLKEMGISLVNLSNPVLLTFIRNESIENIKKNYNNKSVLDQYFSLLLTREQERQQLLLDTNEQISIMQHLATYLVQFDISSEEPQFIKDLLFDILSANLSEYQGRYYDYLLKNKEEIPTDEEFVMKLVHHALLDRISVYSNKIGFINEFIFGLFIGDAVISNKLPASYMTGKYIDLATTSYGIKDKQSSENLFAELQSVIQKLSIEQQLLVDIKLVKKLTQNYADQYFDSLVLNSSFHFDPNFNFINCIFTSCSFDNCSIPISVFQSCQFYNCQFYNVTVINNSENDSELIFSGCSGHDDLIVAASTTSLSVAKDLRPDYERFVLEQYWKVGYDMAEPRRSYRTLFKGTSSADREFVNHAIESLTDRGILHKTSNYIELNFTKMNEIRQILGR